MYETEVNCEEPVDYNLLFCHACLSTNRTLTSVGEYIDIYTKICDFSSMNLTSQINLCWECMALLKKVQIFRRKVENAQKILELCVNKQTPLKDSLSNLTLSSMDTTTFGYPVRDEPEDYENYFDASTKTIDCTIDLNKDIRINPYNDLECYLDKDAKVLEDSFNELMFKIEDVRGQCDIFDDRPNLDLKSSSGDVTVKIEHLSSPETEEERQHRQWQRAAILVYKRICSHRYAHHFMRPVSDDLAPLYSRIVRRPTDLSTIKRRINDGDIRTTAEFTRELLLMFSNALMYNSSHHFIYQMTLELREEALRELSLLAATEAGPGARPRPLRRAPPPPPPRRRASVHHTHDDNTKPAAARYRRRASVFVPAAPPKPAEPRKRAKHDWPCLDDEYLIAKKYKNSMVVLL